MFDENLYRCVTCGEINVLLVDVASDGYMEYTQLPLREFVHLCFSYFSGLCLQCFHPVL